MVKCETLTPVLQKSIITPRTPTPFKNALASLERQSGSVRVLVSCDNLSSSQLFDQLTMTAL